VNVASVRAFTKTNLDEQGFGGLDAAAQARYALPLRFTPGVGTALVVLGLALRSPRWLGATALVALSGALLPDGMLIDLVYNRAVRHVFGAPPLPPTPTPRRFSYLLSTGFLAGAAVAFHYKCPAFGLLLGGLVAVGGSILTTTLWCLGSWSYRLLYRPTVDPTLTAHNPPRNVVALG
jgi:hypothetical protein